MEGRPPIRIRERIPNGALSPRGVVARLLWAFSSSDRRPSYEDYLAARKGVADTTPESFAELCRDTPPDPGLSYRDHLFRPQLRDREGNIYQVIRISHSRISLVREDGTTGTTTPEELDLCFSPVEEPPA
ncbi:MAG: hypothetical protein ACP5OP_06840 [Leptospirillia bacterium]